VCDFVVVGGGTPAPVAPPTTLVAAGPYRWTRNPMYVGVTATLLGEALACWSLPLLIHALCTWTTMCLFVLLYEEPALARRFGESYRAYRRTVPRWLGLPRRPPAPSAGTAPPSPPPPGRG
jgi:protein-S-isoprenylcysteine O-methyltransferase Ste14